MILDLKRPLVGLCGVLLCTALYSQSPATPQSVLTSSLAALGASNVQAVTFSGTATSSNGDSGDSGSFNVQCAVSGNSQLQMQLQSGSRTEIRQISNGVSSGTWIDAQGTSHAMVDHNLYSPESWACPAVLISRLLLSSTRTIQFVGIEQKNGLTTAHFSSTVPATGTDQASQLLSHLTQVDLYIDPQSLQPLVVDFNIHPDNDAGVDIPIEVCFSGYQQFGTVWGRLKFSGTSMAALSSVFRSKQ